MRHIAYDVELRRPGCVIVAAGLGADTRLPGLFPTGAWLTHPTPGMRVYPVTPEQVAILVARAEASHA